MTAVVISILDIGHLFHISLLKKMRMMYNRTYEDKVKSSRRRLHETRDKRPLGRESDRSWCHRNTTSTIKLFWSQLMSPWVSAASYEQGEKFSTFVCCRRCLWSHGLRPKKLYTSVEVIPAPVRVPTQRPLVPSFMFVVC